MKSVLAWLNDRTGYKQLLHEALYERVPGGARWRYVWGSTLVFTFAVQMITGIFLWTAYSPSAQTAWESVYYIQEVMFLGSLVRGIHHFSAWAMVVLLVLHLIQVIIDGAYRAPREVNFWLGLILMQIVLGLALTGYLLPWDQKGYYATKVSTNILSVTPLVGPQLQELVQGGPKYGHHTLTRFFALHAGILPGLLLVFLVAHVWVFRRHGLTVPKLNPERDTTFWPDQVLKDGIACLAVLAGVLTLHWYFGGAELSPPANPAESYSAARPEWYFLFLFQFLRFKWVEHMTGDPKFGAIYVPGAIMAVFVLMPFIGRWKAGHRFNVAFLWAIIGGALGLTILAFVNDSRDEGFLLAKEEAERDAQRAKELADRPSKIPVAGAITLLKNDPFTQGPRLFAKHCASCHRYNGHDGRGRLVYEMIEVDGEKKQFVARPTAADLGDLGSRKWFESLLLDYKMHFAFLKNAKWYRDLVQQRKQYAARFQALKTAIGDKRPNDAQKKELKSLSEGLARLIPQLRKDSLSRQLATREAGRVPIAAKLARQKADFAAAGRFLNSSTKVIEGNPVSEARRKADRQTLDNFAAKIAETQKQLDAQDAKIQSLKESLAKASKAAGGVGDTVAAVEAQISAADEATLLDPDTSEMAMWYGDESDLKALKDGANKGEFKALVEYLVSLGGRKDLTMDKALATTGQAVFRGNAKGTITACTDCHDAPGPKGFMVSPADFTYPDLSGLYGEKWLRSFLQDPARTQHYGVKNRMPAFASRMSDRDLDLLVKWMLRDYYQTKIEPRDPRLKDLLEGLQKRPDAKE